MESAGRREGRSSEEKNKSVKETVAGKELMVGSVGEQEGITQGREGEGWKKDAVSCRKHGKEKKNGMWK